MALLTNVPDLTPVAAGGYYQSLQRIERGFRDLKSLVAIRPIFHYTKKRIRALVFVCFLALVVKWWISRMINPRSQEDGRRFLEEMVRLKAIAVDQTIPLYVRTELTETLRVGMGRLGMKHPEKIIVDGRKPKSVRERHAGGRPKKIASSQTSFLAPF